MSYMHMHVIPSERFVVISKLREMFLLGRNLSFTDLNISKNNSKVILP